MSFLRGRGGNGLAAMRKQGLCYPFSRRSQPILQIARLRGDSQQPVGIFGRLADEIRERNSADSGDAFRRVLDADWLVRPLAAERFGREVGRIRFDQDAVRGNSCGHRAQLV